MPSKPLEPGDPVRLGRFELLGRLGEGGQGIVYLGRGTNPGEERVAVKVLRSTVDANVLERLARELDAIHQVQPFVTAGVIEASAEGDRRYVVSEFIDGPSLQERVDERGPLSEGDLQRLAVGTATALTAIHGAGVVHRDFKPANVLLGPDGPRVVDFGIARLTDAATITSGLIGTPSYVAPEQLAAAAADQRRRHLRLGADDDLRRHRPPGVRRRQRARRHAPDHVRRAGRERPAAVPADRRPGVPGQGSGPAPERPRSAAPPGRPVGAAHPGRPASRRPGRLGPAHRTGVPAGRADVSRARPTHAIRTRPGPCAVPADADPGRRRRRGRRHRRPRRGAAHPGITARFPGRLGEQLAGGHRQQPRGRRCRRAHRPRRLPAGPRSRPRSRAPGKARRRWPPSATRASD